MLLSFSDIDDAPGNEFLGIKSWVDVSSDGTTIPLELSIDRRVLLQSFIIVGVDIKPGSESNCFNNDDNGVIRVAILGSGTFDVTQIDADSVSLEGMLPRWLVRLAPRPCSVSETSMMMTSMIS